MGLILATILPSSFLALGKLHNFLCFSLHVYKKTRIIVTTIITVTLTYHSGLL